MKRLTRIINSRNATQLGTARWMAPLVVMSGLAVVVALIVVGCGTETDSFAQGAQSVTAPGDAQPLTAGDDQTRLTELTEQIRELCQDGVVPEDIQECVLQWVGEADVDVRECGEGVQIKVCAPEGVDCGTLCGDLPPLPGCTSLLEELKGLPEGEIDDALRARLAAMVPGGNVHVQRISSGEHEGARVVCVTKTCETPDPE